MIADFNRRQGFKAIGHLLLSPFGFLAAWFFVKWALPWIAGRFDYQTPDWLGSVSAVVFLILLIHSAWKRHAMEKEAFDLASGAFWTDVPDSGGGQQAQFRFNQATGTAWLVGGLFMSGPLSIFRAITAWKSRLPEDPEMERRMESLLHELQRRKKWVDADLFSRQWDEMMALIRVGAVEFSSLKGRVKAAK